MRPVVACFGKRSYMHAGLDKEVIYEQKQGSPKEIINLILHAGIYLLEGETKKYTHIRICHYMGLRGQWLCCGGEGIFYLGQTRRPGAHQDERSKET